MEETSFGLIPPVQHVRVSTEHQQYSTENLSVVIYSDAGKSGLSLTGRAGLRNWLKDVESGQADY